MIKILFIGFAIIAINVVIQAFVSTYWTKATISTLNKWNKMLTTSRILQILIISFLVLTLLHALHSLVWAWFIYYIPAIRPDFASFLDTLYYSIVTFTTLGYGDMTISSEWKLLSGIEAINGIMLIGWSTALMYSLIQNIFKSIKENNG
ncbi:MAG: potassium channel family protein [Bacteroidota bacterium]